MKKQIPFLSTFLLLMIVLSFPSNSMGQSAKVLPLPSTERFGIELEQEFRTETNRLAKEFHEGESGRGSRTVELLEMVHIDYGQDQEVVVLMLYNVVIEHARGGDDFYGVSVWSVTQGKFVQEETELQRADDIRFIHARGEWAVIERVHYYDDMSLPNFVWYNLNTRELRFAHQSEELPPRPAAKFITKNDGASDIWWELVDENGKTVPLSNALRDEIAEVRHVQPALIGQNHYAVYFLGEKLRLINLDQKTGSTLMSLFPDTEGLSDIVEAPGNDDVIRIAFANMNPHRYDHTSKIFVLDIKNGHLIKKQKFDADLHYGVKGNSPYHLIIAGEDFWFNSRNEIQYRENPMTTDPRMGFGEWDMTTYPFKVRTIVVE